MSHAALARRAAAPSNSEVEEGGRKRGAPSSWRRVNAWAVASSSSTLYKKFLPLTKPRWASHTFLAMTSEMA
eukprot:4838645-Lingulodinium_polyedra.AAC.1